MLGEPEEIMGTGNREWRTVLEERRVLAVAHTVPYARRLLDVLTLFGSDLRIQAAATAPPHVFGDDVLRFLEGVGAASLTWETARRSRFDLALTAGPRGVADLRTPVVTMPHGANYLKVVTDPTQPGVAGLRPSDVMPDGQTLPAAIVLAHHGDLAELERSCPQALDTARVVGDPAHDRIKASLSQRIRYRQALGLTEGQQLVILASTWGPRAHFAGIQTLLARVVSELPRERYRVAVLAHPNIWNAHGPWQVRTWMAPWHQSVALVPPATDWRSVLVAADAVIGDHGSVTLYGTLIGRPILLTGSPGPELNPASPAADLARVAPRLSPDLSLREQLVYAAEEYRHENFAAIAARITSEPGRFARNMRALLYELLGLSQPAHPAPTTPLPAPPCLDTWLATEWRP